MFSGQEFWLACFIIGGIIIAVCVKVWEKLREPNKQLRFPVQEIGDEDMREQFYWETRSGDQEKFLKNTAIVKVFAEIVNSFFFFQRCLQYGTKPKLFCSAVCFRCGMLLFLHCKMKRANLAPKMGPKRVSPEWYCFWGQFSPTEMGLFWYQNLGLNWPLHRDQIRPCKGSIWKTLGPFWIFQ